MHEQAVSIVFQFTFRRESILSPVSFFHSAMWTTIVRPPRVCPNEWPSWSILFQRKSPRELCVRCSGTNLWRLWMIYPRERFLGWGENFYLHHYCFACTEMEKNLSTLIPIQIIAVANVIIYLERMTVVMWTQTLI